MSHANTAMIAFHFEQLEDPRSIRGQQNSLINILTIGICAVICGAESFTDMEEFGNRKKNWFSGFLDLTHGIPSHDTFNNVFARLNPTMFEQCLLSWITSLHELSAGQVLRIDGKTLRRSYQKGDPQSAIHMVSVWSSKNHLSLASQRCGETGGESLAIQKLLDLIDIHGALVTIDAGGTTRPIAQQIIDRQGHYVLAVKGNQRKLHKSIREFFSDHLEDEFGRYPCRYTGVEEDEHGRVDERHYYLAKIPGDFAGADWPGIKAIGMSVHYSQRAGKTTEKIRYYVASRFMSIAKFVDAVRGHWSIENQLHWQLDVSFNEDQLRLRNGHAAANMSIMNRTALGLLKNETTHKRGIKSKRLSCGWDESYLEKVLTGA